jgi:NAD(P)-dependent dehydrogenase (short-subunit alcohol dehydrogenase family)
LKVGYYDHIQATLPRHYSPDTFVSHHWTINRKNLMTQTATFHDLKDTSVFITGGGSGIGAFLTEGFIKQGAKVAFVQRSDATAFCDEMEEKHGVRPLYMPCDITDIPSLQKSITRASQVNGPVTVLVNNAANDQRHTTAEVTEEFWDWSQAINLKAYFFAIQAVIDGMRAAGGGSIINFTSISYMMGNAGYPSYTAANSGINGMTRSMAREFGPDRIRVNALAPGWVLTDKQKEMWVTPQALAAHLERQCLNDTLAPSDIVDPALFLASDSSRMMTGQAMVVDGGVVVTG